MSSKVFKLWVLWCLTCCIVLPIIWNDTVLSLRSSGGQLTEGASCVEKLAPAVFSTYQPNDVLQWASQQLMGRTDGNKQSPGVAGLYAG